jgi:hypothetical protein
MNRKATALVTALVRAASIAVIGVGQAGWSSIGSAQTSASGSKLDDDSGSVAMALDLPGRAEHDTISRGVTGPNSAPAVGQAGTVTVHNSSTAAFTVGGLRALVTHSSCRSTEEGTEP